MIRRPPRSTHCISSAASDVYKRQGINAEYMGSILQTKHEITPISFDDNYQLGMIHNSYAAFVSQWQSYHTTLRLNYTGEQIHSLQEQILDYSTYLLQLKEQVQVYEKDLELCKKQFNRDSLLYTKGVLPCMNYENSKSDYLKQLYGFKGSLANLTNTRLKINQINQQIIAVSYTHLRAHETRHDLVCRLLLEKKKKKKQQKRKTHQ
eukprot:TRINITY_DN27436_c0_g1_i2.p1 TRINITY_DN27436_c0_g1~~TRINITY_DN27436_c0_g1_i2.p1  ORF type:complete len:207 (-),score=36.58 TRINITY_DN27436_c0_g1_i2:45-665(-)